VKSPPDAPFNRQLVIRNLPADFQLSSEQPNSSQDSVPCSFASASSALDSFAGRWKDELRPSATSLFDRSH
jgi:hypothetical protein